MNASHRKPTGATLLPAGVGAAWLAAVLFGAGTPLAKALMAGVGPWMLAGLLYLGSGLGLALLRTVRRTPRPGWSRASGRGWPARCWPAASRGPCC